MSKQIELPNQTITAILNGVRSFIKPVDNVLILKIEKNRVEWAVNHWTHYQPMEDFVKAYSPLQVGDEFYAQEAFLDCENMNYKSDYSQNAHNLLYWKPASEMTCKQSRIKCTIVSVEVKRVNSLTMKEILQVFKTPINGIVKSFSDWYNSQYTNSYDTDTVFLYTFKLKGE